MKFFYKVKWKRILLAVVCLLALAALAGGSYAAYTSQAFQRGVAGNRDTATISFTSDYLQSCANGTSESGYARRSKVFGKSGENDTTLSFNISIYNFINGKTNSESQKTIDYTLKVEFRNGIGKGYGVAYGSKPVSGENGSTTVFFTGTQTLLGRSEKTHTYTLTFPKEDLDKVWIIVTAIPIDTSLSATNNQILAAVITPRTETSTTTFTYGGNYIYEDNTAPGDYSAFNYEIFISSGAATATLKWKTALVEIDKFSLKKLGIDAVRTDGEYSFITFQMDVSAGTGDYLIPFYKKDKTGISKRSWQNMIDEKIIDFSAEKNSAS